jgi:hypothetical protein
MKKLICALACSFLAACGTSPRTSDRGGTGLGGPDAGKSGSAGAGSGSPSENTEDGFTLESGTYALTMANTEENNCGVDADAALPPTLTLSVAGERVVVEELGIEGELNLAETRFRVEQRRTQNLAAEGLACSLDFANTLDLTILAPGSVDADFSLHVAETPLAENEDCELVATTSYGFTSWNSITGCFFRGSFRMTK